MLNVWQILENDDLSIYVLHYGVFHSKIRSQSSEGEIERAWQDVGAATSGNRYLNYIRLIHFKLAYFHKNIYLDMTTDLSLWHIRTLFLL